MSSGKASVPVSCCYRTGGWKRKKLSVPVGISCASCLFIEAGIYTITQLHMRVESLCKQSAFLLLLPDRVPNLKPTTRILTDMCQQNFSVVGWQWV